MNRKFKHSVSFFAATFALCVASIQFCKGQERPPKNEADLIAILQSASPPADKALACKHLAIYGSGAAVPELAQLLTDERLASWARIALEAIPDKVAGEALQKATSTLKGKLLVGAINSIGVRRDSASVDTLAVYLKDPDAEVASAAAVALGRVGNASASRLLQPMLASAHVGVQSAVAEGCVLCAEKFLSEGDSVKAIEIYDQVRKANVPPQRILEATRGAILARGRDGIPLLVELFKSTDGKLFQLSLGLVREFPGREADKILAAELKNLAPDRAALLIQALADRKDTVDLPTILLATGNGNNEVRAAAINAIGRVGDASCVAPLLDIANESDAQLTSAAKTALAELSGEGVDKEIVARLTQSQGSKMHALLIEVVGLRRIEATAELVKALDQPDQSIRGAALTALGATVPAKNLSVLIKEVVAPKHGDDGPLAKQALKAASIRMPDREACSAELATAFDRSKGSTRSDLLEILAAVGGTKALETIGKAAKSGDSQLHDISSRLLGEWMTIDAAPVLLDLAKTAPADKYKVRALRGYIRIARQFVMPEAQRVEMCQNAFEASNKSAEKKLVLEVAKRYPSLGMLKLAVSAIQMPELKDDATEAALLIAQKLNGNLEEVRELLAKIGLDKVTLEIVKAEYGAGATQKDVTETLQKQVAGIPIIALPSSNYNASFGGDPMPGTPKQLKIQYRFNGTLGDVTFPENSLILLPPPKSK